MKTRAFLNDLEPYVPGTRIKDGIKLSSNENALGPSPLALEAIPRITGDIHRYPDGAMRTLREAIAARWGVSDEMVICGNGSDEIMVMIAGALIEPGTNAVTGAHTFSQYAFATRIFGGEVRTSAMPDGRFDLESILEQTDAQTRVVWLCSPNNPTGAILTHRELEGFLERLSPEVLVVIDEAYGEYAEADEYHDSIALIGRFPNLIRLRTFSKIYGLAALRVGYGIARPEVITAVGHLRQPFNVGTVAQSAATAALGDEAFVRRSLENNRVEKRRLCEVLDRIGTPYLASEANFVCADVGGLELNGGARGAKALVAALADEMGSDKKTAGA
ncbi:MAG: histidinol-phosphate transaminase, partial [Spirochaetota bacterium]